MKRHTTGSVLSEFDQKPEESSSVMNEEDFKDAYDREMEELEKEEDILDIDLDAEKGDDSVENNFKDDEDGNVQSSKETTAELNEKIEAMIEKVTFWVENLVSKIYISSSTLILFHPGWGCLALH